jgi:hypothetical protein
LPRRANHRHIGILARIDAQQSSPRRETGRGLFVSDFLHRAFKISLFESDGGRIRDATFPLSAPCRKTRPQARRRPNLRDQAARAITRESEMTAYLISLALAGLVAIALWEAMS